jgi:transcriptional regulator with XRE-family HTH domain
MDKLRDETPVNDLNGLTNLQTGLGEQVRRLRQEKGFTLEEVAQLSGCSLGSLSQLERGKANPSFMTLARIAQALNVPVARLLQIENSTSPVVRRFQGRRLNVHHKAEENGTLYELLTPDLDRALEVMRLEVPPLTSTETTPFVHQGEEVGIILRGTHEVHLNGTCYTLQAGDTISYSSTIPHWYRNPGPEVVEAIWIITPPTF